MREQATGGFEAAVAPGGTPGERWQPLDADPLGDRREDGVATAATDEACAWARRVFGN